MIGYKNTKAGVDGEQVIYQIDGKDNKASVYNFTQ